MQRFVEIGRSREKVEILDEPAPPPAERIGRIKHANGENAAIDFHTYRDLRRAAEQSRKVATLLA